MVLRNRASGVVLLLLALAVSGCALSDEGAVDYRRGDIKQAATPGRKDLYQTRALKGKNLKTDLQNAKFSKMDSVSINIQQAFIRDCFDLALNPLRGFRKNCEIAIIANVFEFGNGADFNFSEEGLKDGRIVFYSGDVYPGQFLNFNNLPVYGPIQYSGNPLGIMFAIVEIDAE